MLDRAGILNLIPHGGASCLLDRVEAWSPGMISCTTLSHLDPGNVLRRAGRLGTICGVEMGLQAAAVHGALCGGKAPSRPGYLASLRAVDLRALRLDDAGHGTLTITAFLEHGDERALSYGFDVRSAAGTSLVSGRAIVILQAGS